MSKQAFEIETTYIRPFKDDAIDRVLAWIERTTSHGLPNIVRSNNLVIKIMWILFFLASLTYCSYVIIVSLIDYFKYQTVVSTTYVKETPTMFPAVTLCNLSMLLISSDVVTTILQCRPSRLMCWSWSQHHY
jgi:hypothetical protein